MSDYLGVWSKQVELFQSQPTTTRNKYDRLPTVLLCLCWMATSEWLGPQMPNARLYDNISICGNLQCIRTGRTRYLFG